MTQATDAEPAEAVTVVVSRRVKKGCEQEFEKLSTEMSLAANDFPGYLGTNMFRPASPQDPEYRIVFKFNTLEELQFWQASSVRAELLEKFEPLLIEPAKTEILNGIVTWFTIPSQNPVNPPPKYKMTFVSWLALYPTVTLIFVFFGDILSQIPLLLRTFIITAVVMVIMSYVLMPRFTKLFAPWLFAKQTESR